MKNPYPDIASAVIELAEERRPIGSDHLSPHVLRRQSVGNIGLFLSSGYGDPGRHLGFYPRRTVLFPRFGSIKEVATATAWRAALWTEQAIKMMDEEASRAIDPRTGKVDTEGAGTEIYPEARASRRPLVHRPTTTDLQKFYSENKTIFETHPELRVGWDRTDRGWELNVGASTNDKAACAHVARRLDQRAAWDIRKRGEIPTGGKGERTRFPDYSLELRLRDLRGWIKPAETGMAMVDERFVSSVKTGREQ